MNLLENNWQAKKLEAEITICYGDDKTAAAVTDAVSPDNFRAPQGLIIKTLRREKEVSTFIKCGKGFSTFIATIDDLLFSISIAEKTIKTVKKTF